MSATFMKDDLKGSNYIRIYRFFDFANFLQLKRGH